MLYLKKLSKNDGQDIYDMLQGIESNDHGFHNNVKDMPHEQFTDWLRKNADYSNGMGIEDWMVPGTTYWLFDDEIPVGCGRLRHCLNENLRKNGGHIGYAVSCPHRGKGYGNALLRLLLTEAREMGISEVLITTSKDNERSNKVILTNGGKLTSGEIDEKNYYVVNIKE
ncbi:MAG: GNAT family N-acetyltransferase [Oscillospiraceae bacterium]|nr:GNAT family N-acetyltransferase [Oscillospiraceae bacterium]